VAVARCAGVTGKPWANARADAAVSNRPATADFTGPQTAKSDMTTDAMGVWFMVVSL
jgi:hypothetical protein